MSTGVGVPTSIFEWTMKITGAHHTSYTVSDLERSLNFYSGLLGFQILWQREIKSQYFRDIVGHTDCYVKAAHLGISGSDHVLELIEYIEPYGASADVRTQNTGSSHIAFLVDDLPSVYEEMNKQGVKFRSPPVEITEGRNRGGWGIYFEDPDGITMEFFQPPGGK